MYISQTFQGGSIFSILGSEHTYGQDSLFEPEDGGCGEADGAHEGVGASIVAGGDTAPVLEAGEHVLDPMMLAVKNYVIWIGSLAAPGRGDARGDAPLDQRFSERTAVLATVGDQGGAGRSNVENEAGALVVAHLPGRKQQHDGPALAIAHRVQLGLQAAFRATEMAGKTLRVPPQPAAQAVAPGPLRPL